MKRREVEWVELSGGTRVPSHLLVCPKCKTLDLGTTVDTAATPMVASCSLGHEWPVVVN